MKRIAAIFCLVALVLTALYAIAFHLATKRLEKEEARTSANLQLFFNEQTNAAKLYFEAFVLGKSSAKSLTEFRLIHPGLFPTRYSELGIARQSRFAALPPGLKAQNTRLSGNGSLWIASRWVVDGNKLWLETLGSKAPWPRPVEVAGAPIQGLASAVPQEWLRPNDPKIGLALAPAASNDLHSRTMTLPGVADSETSPQLVLKYKIGFWTHLLIWFLALGLVMGFLRILRNRGPKRGKREIQLEEELAYLSRTYQNLSKTLRMERQKVESILNSAPDGIFTCSPSGTITTWNRSMEALTGIPSETAIGKHYRESLHIYSSGGQLLSDTFSLSFVQNKKLNLFECSLEVLNQGDGSASLFFPVSLGAAPVMLPDGTVEEVVVTVKDIRPQKAAERLRQDMQAMITHDLRSPLAAMLGYAGLVANAKTCKNEADAQKYLESLMRVGKEMLMLINNLLDWSCIEEGALFFQKESLAVAPILQETVESLGVLGKARQVSIVLDGEANDLWALTDGEKLKQILNNLITNAVKFEPPGGVVTVHAAEEGDKIRISISDHGPGIPFEDREKLFQKFSNLRKSESSGTGLGLYIVKTLTDALDGRIEVKSEAGHGSTFSVILPAMEKVEAHTQQLSLLSLVSPVSNPAN